MAIGSADQEVFLGRELTQRREVSEHTARRVDEEIKRVLDEAHEHARELVSEHRDLLEDFAQALLDRETLDAAEIGALDAGEPLPALPTTDDAEDRESASAPETSDEDSSGEGGDEVEAPAVEASSEGQVEEESNVEETGADESSPDTVRTPVVQLGVEDPEAGASS